MSNKVEKQLTIFTPTYNRAYILPQLYNSLKGQTNKEFVWTIVDDGSTDDTESLVSGWMNEHAIDIVYIKQENGGKMKAHNTGVQNATTELFFCVDSDDYLVSDAVEIILLRWNSLKEDEKSNLAGLVGYRGETPEKIMGNSFPRGVMQDTLGGLYDKGFTGETALIFKTDILKNFLFPIIGDEKFITEAYVYNQIDQQYELYVCPKVLTICEYRLDGLTKNNLKIVFNNPCGYVAYNIQRGNYAENLRKRFKFYIGATAFDMFSKDVEMPVEPEHKIIYILSRPFGKVFYLYRRLLLAKNNKK